MAFRWMAPDNTPYTSVARDTAAASIAKAWIPVTSATEEVPRATPAEALRIRSVDLTTLLEKAMKVAVAAAAAGMAFPA